MTSRRFSTFSRRHSDFLVRLAVAFLAVAFMSGCFGNYGSYKLSQDVTKMFESQQVPNDYKYYYTGPEKTPDALLGLQRDYTLDNDLWIETKMSGEQLKRWIQEINLVGYSIVAFGRYILDPNGKTIGIYYSKWDGGPVKVEPGNKVVVFLPETHRNQGPLMAP